MIQMWFPQGTVGPRWRLHARFIRCSGEPALSCAAYYLWSLEQISIWLLLTDAAVVANDIINSYTTVPGLCPQSTDAPHMFKKKYSHMCVCVCEILAQRQENCHHIPLHLCVRAFVVYVPVCVCVTSSNTRSLVAVSIASHTRFLHHAARVSVSVQK